jgi:hypothetical protein
VTASARLRAVQASGEAGSTLALALVFLMFFGVYVGTVLQFAATGQRTAVSVEAEAVSTYAGGGAIDGAINEIRTDLTAGVDPGGSGPPASTLCFNLPADALGNASDITVRCQPRTGSGSNTALASAPEHAVLALTDDPAEGVYVPPLSNVRVRGSIASDESLEVGFFSGLTSSGTISAASCTISAWSVVTPAPDCSAAGVPDPAWSGAPTTYPSVVPTLPGCSTPLVTLSPGTYLSRQALQAVLDCANTVVWFQPGTYYFDFRDGGTHEIAVTNAVVVGGTPSGWTPGVTAAGSVPVPTAASPNRSACDTSAPGVDFVFGADSRLSVTTTNAKVELCAAETGTAQQHVVLRGLANQLGPYAVAQPTAGTATAAVNSGTGAQWSNPTSNGAAVGGGTTSVSVTRGNTSRALRVGPFTTGLVPPDATGISVTVEVRGRMSAGPGTQSVRLTNGSTTTPLTTLRTCPMPAGCTETALRTDSVTIPVADSPTADDFVNALSVDVLVSSANVASPNGGTTTAFVDGVTVRVNFTAPLRATAAATTLLRTSGSANNMTVAMHGTVYAPGAAVDLAFTNVPYVVIDRGLAVRHARLAMAPANGYAGPLISVPDPAQGPRRVLLTAQDASGRQLGRAYVTFSDGSGSNGSNPQVTEWSVG